MSQHLCCLLLVSGICHPHTANISRDIGHASKGSLNVWAPATDNVRNMAIPPFDPTVPPPTHPTSNSSKSHCKYQQTKGTPQRPLSAINNFSQQMCTSDDRNTRSDDPYRPGPHRPFPPSVVQNEDVEAQVKRTHTEHSVANSNNRQSNWQFGSGSIYPSTQPPVRRKLTHTPDHRRTSPPHFGNTRFTKADEYGADLESRTSSSSNPMPSHCVSPTSVELWVQPDTPFKNQPPRPLGHSSTPYLSNTGFNENIGYDANLESHTSSSPSPILTGNNEVSG